MAYRKIAQEEYEATEAVCTRESWCLNCKLYSRAKGLKRRYGITEDEYNVLLESQDGKCAICGGDQGRIHPETGEPKHLAVDHDHETDEIRGLLCDACNQGLGIFKDDPNRLLAAAAYLMKAGK